MARHNKFNQAILRSPDWTYHQSQLLNMITRRDTWWR